MPIDTDRRVWSSDVHHCLSRYNPCYATHATRTTWTLCKSKRIRLLEGWCPRAVSWLRDTESNGYPLGTGTGSARSSWCIIECFPLHFLLQPDEGRCGVYSCTWPKMKPELTSKAVLGMSVVNELGRLRLVEWVVTLFASFFVDWVRFTNVWMAWRGLVSSDGSGEWYDHPWCLNNNKKNSATRLRCHWPYHHHHHDHHHTQAPHLPGLGWKCGVTLQTRNSWECWWWCTASSVDGCLKASSTELCRHPYPKFILTTSLANALISDTALDRQKIPLVLVYIDMIFTFPPHRNNLCSGK